LLSLELGKEFLQLYAFLLNFKVILVKPLEEYKGIHSPSRISLLLSLKRVFKKILGGVKNAYSLAYLSC
jgi:hypothetical protein